MKQKKTGVPGVKEVFGLGGSQLQDEGGWVPGLELRATETWGPARPDAKPKSFCSQNGPGQLKGR